MRRKAQAPLFSGEEPPAELLRYPVRAVGGYAGFEDWLRARQEWRRTHGLPLPGLFARDRHALDSITRLDPDVVRGERAASTAAPEWAQRAQAKRSSSGRGIGRLPVVAHPVDSPGDGAQGGAE